MAIDEETEFISLLQAAKRLRIAPVTLKKAVERGELPGFQVGTRHIRVTLAECRAWIRKQRIPVSDSVARNVERTLADQERHRAS